MDNEIKLVLEYIKKEVIAEQNLSQVFLEEVEQIYKSKPDRARAKQYLIENEALILELRHDEAASVVLANLTEKTRNPAVYYVWIAIFVRYPTNILAARMSMRWFWRRGDLETGLNMLIQATPLKGVDRHQTELALMAMMELKLFADIDTLMHDYLQKFPKVIALRNRYVLCLARQRRYHEALEVAAQRPVNSCLSDSMKAHLADIEAKSKLPQEKIISPRSAALGDIVALYKERDIETLKAGLADHDGTNVCFFTGQLGSGGAERQLSRIAAKLKELSDAGQTDIHPYVCVRHAKAELGSNFFSPVLVAGNVDLVQLLDMAKPDIDALSENEAIVEFLKESQPNLVHAILNLALVLKERRTDVLYAWQDGAVLIGVVAGLLAGVPKIICNFRGMSPNHRPEMMRDELYPIYRELATTPGVEYSANSRIAAESYVEWLGIDFKKFTVIPNAVSDFTQQAKTAEWIEEQAKWDAIVERSPQCEKTVIGVYRYDDNKRPLMWAKLAAEYSKNYPDTRFIIVGKGKLMQEVELLIGAEDAGNRVFMAGVSSLVHFWMEKADLLMHLARMEGLPNVIIESQIAGTPVLSTPAGGTPEVVEHNVTGCLLSDALDPSEEEILDSLERLLNNTSTLKRMAKVSREYALKRYNPKTILEVTQSLLAK